MKRCSTTRLCALHSAARRNPFCDGRRQAHVMLQHSLVRCNTGSSRCRSIPSAVLPVASIGLACVLFHSYECCARPLRTTQERQRWSQCSSSALLRCCRSCGSQTLATAARSSVVPATPCSSPTTIAARTRPKRRGCAPAASALRARPTASCACTASSKSRAPSATGATAPASPVCASRCSQPHRLDAGKTCATLAGASRMGA